MYDFSKELILNDLTSVSVLTDAEDPGLKAGDSALLIKRFGKFPKSYVDSVYKNVGYAPVKEVANVDLTGLTLADLTNKVIKLSFDSRLSGAADGSYSRWGINQGKPTYAEYFVAATPASVGVLATALAASFNKQLAPNADVVITVSGNNLVFTAKNEYQRLDGVALELLAIDPVTSEADPVLLKSGTTTTAGKEGFGTTWFITKNLRLPTIENTRFMGTLLDERPIANSIYDQYTFKMDVLRNITGQSAVGQKIESITMHIVYVLQSQSAAFQALVTDALGYDSIVVAKTNASANPDPG